MKPFPASLRAARAMLQLKRSKVDENLGFTAGTVARLERGGSKSISRDAYKLRAEYERKGILFEQPSESYEAGVRWKEPAIDDHFRSAQFRAARAILNLSLQELSAATGVDKTFISRLELNKFKSLTVDTANILEAALSKLGVDVVDGVDGSAGGGVRLRDIPEQTTTEVA